MMAASKGSSSAGAAASGGGGGGGRPDSVPKFTSQVWNAAAASPAAIEKSDVIACSYFRTEGVQMEGRWGATGKKQTPRRLCI
jgi:hypothetical protein